MDLGKSFGFVFEDQDWVKKLLLGGVISIVPILGLAAVGYMLRTLKNVAAGAPRPLPEWDDLGGDFVKGLVTVVAGFIYALPLLVLFVPVVVLGALAGQNSNSDAGGLLVMAGVWCLAVPYGLILSAWLPAATARFALDGDLGAFFRFGEIWGLIRRNLGNYIIALLVYMVVSQVAAMIGAIALGIGAVFTGFWATLFYAHLLGQVVLGDKKGVALTPAI